MMLHEVWVGNASKGPLFAAPRIFSQEPLKKKPSMSSIQADLARQLGEHSGDFPTLEVLGRRFTTIAGDYSLLYLFMVFDFANELCFDFRLGLQIGQAWRMYAVG